MLSFHTAFSLAMIAEGQSAVEAANKEVISMLVVESFWAISLDQYIAAETDLEHSSYEFNEYLLK